MDQKYKYPRVGVGVIVLKGSKVLLGKRKGSHGADTWNFPGGHLNFHETPQECAIREVIEETGIKIKNIRRGPWTNDTFKKADKHYITLFMIADYEKGEPQILEPEKCEKWHWFSWEKLPKPLFLPIKNLLKLDFNPFSRLQGSTLKSVILLSGSNRGFGRGLRR